MSILCGQHQPQGQSVYAQVYSTTKHGGLLLWRFMGCKGIPNKENVATLTSHHSGGGQQYPRTWRATCNSAPLQRHQRGISPTDPL